MRLGGKILRRLKEYGRAHTACATGESMETAFSPAAPSISNGCRSNREKSASDTLWITSMTASQNRKVFRI